jgi:hypothetical protein
LLGVGLVLSLSCSILSGGTEPDEAPGSTTVVATPTDESVTDGGPADDDPGGAVGDEPIAVDSDALAQLDSYRATMTWVIEKADGTGQEFAIEQSAIRDPAALQFRMIADGESMEYIEIGDQMWMRFGDEWIQSSSGDSSGSDDFGDFLSTSDDWISGLEDGDYEYLGTETVNGVRTRHYRAEHSEGWGALFGDPGTVDDVESGVADVWIADDDPLPEFVVRFVVAVEGKVDDEDASMTLSQEVTQINEPFVIEPPEGVALGGLPDGVPLYPDASDVTQFGTMTTFSSLDDVETVDGFYQDALAAAGWAPSEDAVTAEGMAMSTWTKDDQTLTLTISSGDDDSGASVIVMLEDSE